MARGAFAPVAVFELDQASLCAVPFSGFAAPEGGPDPCLVELVAEREVLSVARAVGYSRSAAQRGTRFGWCAFALGGLDAARSAGEPAEIRCAVSGSTLATFLPDVLAARRTARRAATVSDLRAFVGEHGGCADPEHIRPFYEHYLATHSTRDCVKAAYLYFLGRAPAEPEIDGLAPRVVLPMTMDWFARLFTECAEFREGRGFPLPGPFDPSFPLGRDLFDLP